MTDTVDAATRSRMMSGIKGKNTKPELILRRYLHRRGFRYRIHRKDLPGNPDLVLASYRLAVFVHGCFWHRHEDCFYASVPTTRPEFWQKKFAGNVERDGRHISQLILKGWRVLIVWECGLNILVDDMQEIVALIGSELNFMVWPEIAPRTKK
ncbi:very short patch repair endonuclease [Pseudomonas sp. NPDC085632]|uniref:very short patch repair endonuclease n=1 Tax=Pseudomonas sp. NPDC085632 TaxID=3364429 RepID=UPI0037CB6AC6